MKLADFILNVLLNCATSEVSKPIPVFIGPKVDYFDTPTNCIGVFVTKWHVFAVGDCTFNHLLANTNSTVLNTADELQVIVPDDQLNLTHGKAYDVESWIYFENWKYPRDNVAFRSNDAHIFTLKSEADVPSSALARLPSAKSNAMNEERVADFVRWQGNTRKDMQLVSKPRKLLTGESCQNLQVSGVFAKDDNSPYVLKRKAALCSVGDRILQDDEKKFLILDGREIVGFGKMSTEPHYDGINWVHNHKSVEMVRNFIKSFVDEK